VARQAWQICRGTWPLNAGNGAVLWHRPGCRGKGIMTELILTPGQRSRCGRVLVSQGSGAHTGNDVVLLQTPVAQETANGVELSAGASHVVTGIRSANHSHGVRVMVRTQCPWSDSLDGSRPAPVAPAGENAPAEVDFARIRAERNASQGRQERINSQSRIKKPRRRRIRRSAVPPVQGVTAPDLPEGI
jgi:hypothetical protein